ncbi:MAG TPA: slipin family protein [Bryobacteraceae bacterium]|nr:slipin family protein [Bryobacteraceae bacterium]
MFRRILVGDNERVLLIRKKRLSEILGPGEYWIFMLGQVVEFERYSIRDIAFDGPWSDAIVKLYPALADEYFTLVETNDTSVGVVYFDGKTARVVPPGKRALFWKGAVNVTFDLIDVREAPQVDKRLLAPLARLGRESLITYTQVDECKRGLMYVDGRLVRELEAGMYGFWSAVAVPRVEIVEMRRQTIEVTGQEILTKDKVAIRVNVSAVFEIVDVAASRGRVKDVQEFLYRTLQIAVRQTLGKRDLEQVLAEKADLDEAVSAGVRAEMEGFGVRVGSIAIKDIILPGDIRDILNQVVTAEKQAQANLIRRREETAATRSLLNTAKLMEDNPLLVRLKELEALEKIAGKVEKITVIGGVNALLDRTVTLRAE